MKVYVAVKKNIYLELIDDGIIKNEDYLGKVVGHAELVSITKNEANNKKYTWHLTNFREIEPTGYDDFKSWNYLTPVGRPPNVYQKVIDSNKEICYLLSVTISDYLKLLDNHEGAIHKNRAPIRRSLYD